MKQYILQIANILHFQKQFSFQNMFRYGTIVVSENDGRTPSIWRRDIIVDEANEKMKYIRERDSKNPSWYWSNEMEMKKNLIINSKSNKIVHLNSRPTQIYYEGSPQWLNDSNDAQQICEARVPINDIYVTIDDSNKAYVDIFFYCNGWCCQVDCCQISVTFIIAVSCVGIILCALLLNIFVRKVCQRLLMFRALRRFHLGKKHRKRNIMRANAQRRRRSSDKRIEGMVNEDLAPKRTQTCKKKVCTRESMPRNVSTTIKEPPLIIITEDEEEIHDSILNDS